MSSDPIEACIDQLVKLGLNETQIIDHVGDYFKKKNINKDDEFWRCVEELRNINKDSELDRKSLVKDLKLSVSYCYY